MSFLIKLILAPVIGISAALVAASFIVSETYIISSDYTFDAPSKKVYAFMSDLKNFPLYNAALIGHEQDLIFGGETSKIGGTMVWSNLNWIVKEGDAKISALSPTDITIQFNYTKPFKIEEHIAFKIVPVDDQLTKVTVEYYGKSPFPWNGPSILKRYYIKQTIGKSLLNIEEILKSK